MARSSQSIRAIFDYVLIVACVLVAAIDLLGVGWFWESQSTCHAVFLMGAPLAMLVATSSVFLASFSGWRIWFFAGAVGTSVVIYSAAWAGGLGICPDPIRVNVGLLPYFALLLLVGRAVLIGTGSNRAEMKSEASSV